MLGRRDTLRSLGQAHSACPVVRGSSEFNGGDDIRATARDTDDTAARTNSILLDERFDDRLSLPESRG
jgi:hypothetical protein